MFLGIRSSALLLLVNKIIIEMTFLFLFIVFHLNLFYKGILQVLFCSVLILVNCSHGVCVFEKMIMLPVGILRASISINFTIVFVAVSVHVILNILRCNVTWWSEEANANKTKKTWFCWLYSWKDSAVRVDVKFG